MKIARSGLLLLAALMLLSACSRVPGPEPGPTYAPTAAPTASPIPTEAPVLDPEAGVSYTFSAWAESLPSSWDPQQAVSQDELRLASLYSGSLVRVTASSLEYGGPRFEYELAESITDVTESHRGDLIKYGTSLSGRRASEISSGFVFEIKLRPGSKWSGGEPITADDFIYSMRAFSDPVRQKAGAAAFAALSAAPAGFRERLTGSDSERRGLLGLYKADEYTLVCVTEGQVSFEEFLLACSRPMLVNPAMYSGLGTVYGSSAEYIRCSGPYLLESTDESSAVLTRNPYWRGWSRDEDGSMISFTSEELDGERPQRFQATRIVLTVSGAESAKQSFLSGELDAFSPDAAYAAELSPAALLYTVQEPTAYSLVFNTEPEVLSRLDQERAEHCSVVLSNESFRRGISLAVDRAAVAAETGFEPLLGLIPDACVYNAFSSRSSYRASEPAIRALRSVYLSASELDADGDGLATDEGLTGFDPSAAAACFARAFAELTEAGLYSPGDAIYIRVVCSEGRVPKYASKSMELIGRFINAAAEGTGFGRVTLECVGGADPLSVARGEYAMGWSTVQFDSLHPFEGLLRFFDPELYPTEEGGGFDPVSRELELNYAGRSESLSLAAWARSITGDGMYAYYPDQARLPVAAELERELLASYCRIPISQRVGRVLLSDKVCCIKRTDDPFTGYGGAEFIAFNHSDPEPAE